FMRCSGRIGPSGCHQSAARALNRDTSSADTSACGCMVAPPPARQYVCFIWQQLTLANDQRSPTMPRIVMKFGGTSVADLDRIRNVATRVKREVDAGNEVAAVGSAMAGTSNPRGPWCPARYPRPAPCDYCAG